MIWASNPPNTYFSIAGWLFLVRAIGLFDPSGWSFTGQYSAWQLSAIPRALFMYKLLYLGLDLGCWLLLRRMVSAAQRRTVDVIWLLSPVTLLGVYVMGQTDMFPIFFTVLSLYFAWLSISDESSPKRYAWFAMLSLGIGSGYKIWPLLLVPVWAIFLGKKPVQRVLFFIAGGLPFLLSILPFISGSIFRKWVLGGFAVGFLNSPSAGVFPIFSWFIFAWGLIHILILFYIKDYNFRNLWVSAITILALYFIIIPSWEFYWLAWLLPFYVLAVAERADFSGLYLCAIIYFLFYAMTFWNLGIELFLPTGSTIYSLVPTPHLREVIFNNDSGLLNRMLSVGFSLFSAVNMGIIASLWIPIKRKVDIQTNRINLFWICIVPTFLLFACLIGVYAISLKSRPDLLQPALSGLWITITADPIFFGFLLILVLGLIISGFTHREAAQVS
jgi:hypothetical protein